VQVFKHHHDETTGRTSSIGQHNLCLDSKGQILNDHQFRNTTCGEYVKQASKVITLVDLAGEKQGAGVVRLARHTHHCVGMCIHADLRHWCTAICLRQSRALLLLRPVSGELFHRCLHVLGCAGSITAVSWLLLCNCRP
jgi:hypothetical protein